MIWRLLSFRKKHIETCIEKIVNELSAPDNSLNILFQCPKKYAVITNIRIYYLERYYFFVFLKT